MFTHINLTFKTIYPATTSSIYLGKKTYTKYLTKIK